MAGHPAGRGPRPTRALSRSVETLGRDDNLGLSRGLRTLAESIDNIHRFVEGGWGVLPGVDSERRPNRTTGVRL